MSKTSEDEMSLQNQPWQRELQAMALLSTLNYRTGKLSSYLDNIASGVSKLVGVDWSVVTLCQEGFERVLASSVDMGEGEHVYSLHGQLTGSVIQMGCSLAVEDATENREYGEPPEGYCSYLGIPLRTAQGEVIGTICSFHRQPRKFTKEEMQIVELFAERAATAIDHYHLYQQQCKFNHVLEAEVEKRTAQLRAAQTQLVEQERLAAIGEFAAIIVHEIRNPLTTMMMGLKYFQKTIMAESAQERLVLALDEGSRLQRLLGEILLYAKPQMLQLCELDINEFIRELLIPIREMPEALGRQIEFTPISPAVRILADKDKLKQVFINIVRNACEAVSAGEKIKWVVETQAIDKVGIHVHNGGEPIPTEILSKLTQPFFSTKSSGTGLGLAITQRIVKAHGGELSIKSELEYGTTVSVQFSIFAGSN
ncbi:MAG: GAF domain-containing protein [Methylacidiphilales bacterium]|nr:GAF domain-containing protein [Candidatus Methylacidiphilales bacterium]NJR15369.1 GAF domain-containing protein [Calothrix sp. CSU_2_0]